MRIQLPKLFSDHMMLQREKELLIWGTYENVSSIKIKISSHIANATLLDGKFSCKLPPQNAATGVTLYIYADEELEQTIQDINIGDIWMACGQSNMEFHLRYDADWNYTKNLPRNPSIRMFHTPKIAYEGQVRDLPEYGYWFEEGDKAFPTFSAPGYSFARTLQPEIDVPVGIIGCNWDGTPACAWIGEAYLLTPPLDIFEKEYQEEIAGFSEEEIRKKSLEAFAFEDSYRHQLEWRSVMYGLTIEEQKLWLSEHKNDPQIPMGPYHPYRPHGLYHTMVQKTAPFPIKGVLWYQGESDQDHADIYDQTMNALISSFRSAWNDPALPFLFVQLAPFGHWMECTNKNYALLRQQQEKVSETIPNTAMASIMDLGSRDDIHPKFKMEVGRRLALLAMGHVYEMDGLFDPPTFDHAIREENRIHLYFGNSGASLRGDSLTYQSFRCSSGGDELKIHSCNVSENRVTLILEKTDEKPVHVSYAEEDYCTVHIWNEAGLSMKPFHCDVY